MSQSDFATLIGVSVRTLPAHGKRNPLSVAKILIRIAEKHSDILLEALRFDS